MKIQSVNIGESKTVKWKGRTYTTGIFKKQVAGSVFLGETDVKGDDVINRKYHGGIDKACYVYSADNYPFWEEQYPHLIFENGMFGENLTIKGFDEKQVFIGDKFKVGEAIVEVSQPREPCSALKLRFDDAQIVKKFFKAPYPGMYLRVIAEGNVKKEDEFEFIENNSKFKFSVFECYNVLKSRDKSTIEKMLKLEYLSKAFKDTLLKL